MPVHTRSPEAELRSFLEKLDPKIQKLTRSLRAAMRRRLPTANELAYDYKTSIVIAYTPTEHGIDGVASIAARPDGVRLYLGHGPQLPDPAKLLRGTGKQARYVQIDAASQVARPDVKALIEAAIARTSVAFRSSGRGTLIIRSTGARRRSVRRR